MSGPNRREVLAGLGAAAAVAACGGDGDGRRPGDDDDATASPTGDTAPPPPEPAPDRDPEPAAWEAPGAWDEVAFAWGVAAGDPLADSAVLWVRTLEAELELVVMAARGDAWTEVARLPVLPTEGVAQVEVGGLAADTAHAYAFTAAGTRRRSPVGRFRTAPAAGAFRKLVIGATSCLGGGDPAFPSLASAAAERLDLFLFLGDTVYADGAADVDGYRAYWRRVEATPSYRDLRGSCGTVTTWDDHEVANNWTLGEPSPTQTRIDRDRLEAGTDAFLEAVPLRRGPGGVLWRTIPLGPLLDVFVLDCRGERGPDRIVSDAQLDWIRTALAESTATFKLVMTSIHATDHSAMLGPVEAADRWQGFPAQRDALVAAADGAPGTFFVTGDMHYGAFQRVGAEGDPGAGLLEVAAGPGGSEIFPLGTFLAIATEEAKAQYLEVVETWNWARMVLDPGAGTLEVTLVGDAGQALATATYPLAPAR